MVTAIQKQNNGITQNKAMYYLKTIWPKAPDVEVEKAGMLCYQYGLNPLLKQVYLVQLGNEWVTVLGIKATRQLAQRNHSYGFIDGPRIMTADEQKQIFGKVYPDRIYAICKIKDIDGNIYPGYGWWPANKVVHGSDKGNSELNMAFIRAERNALDKMAPGELPDADVVDEAYQQVDVKAAIEAGKQEVIEQAEKDIDTLYEKQEYTIVLNKDWVQQVLTEIKWNPIQYLHETFNTTGVSVFACLREMTPAQQDIFANEIRTRFRK